MMESSSSSSSNSSNDEKKQQEDRNQPIRLQHAETLAKVKSIAGHGGLLATLMIYCLIGGVVFRVLELPAETERIVELKEILLLRRGELLASFSDNATADLADWEEAVLRPYEQALQNAARSNFMVEHIPRVSESADDEPYQLVNERWSILQAVFFASTIITTIGYGNLYPTTFFGRLFCVLFALIGIPLTLTVIADYGQLFADAVSAISKKLRARLPGDLFKRFMPANQTFNKSLGALLAVVLLFVYLACGAAIFMLWETQWSFFEGFYFCFVTMTTIGFGDIVPTNPKYMLFCTGYILVGLALTSTIIELVRRQYASSWRRLQALSGPLADALKKIGEQAGGDISVLQTDLRKLLNMSMNPKRQKNGLAAVNAKDGDVDEAIEAILRDLASARSRNIAHRNQHQNAMVQIIIYESSV